MKLRVLFVALAMCLFATGNGHTQEASKAGAKSDIPDAVTADGKHYTIEFENEFVRVLRIHYGPHEVGNMHNHPHSTTVFLTNGKLKMTTPDGRSRVGTVKAGQVVWEEAGPHQPENLTDEPFEAVRVELKNPTPDVSTK
jgi:quercetin dioxygenase-like cupin family protein